MNNLKQDIKKCIDNFKLKYGDSERNAKQSIAAENLFNVKNNQNSDNDICVLQGPAGCGKTKISLEWALNSDANKIIWVCPRVQVCMSIFMELSSSDYLNYSKIEIFTGDDKRIFESGEIHETQEDEKFSGDIVITTIDQIVNKITTHRDVDSLVEFMESHVIFDEFHELINVNPHNILFMELIESKKRLGRNSNTLLLSATPNYLFCKKFLDIDDRNIIKVETFNQSKYKINIIEYDDDKINPMITSTIEGNSIVIFNTATDSQFSFIKNMKKENSILFHSKFSLKDRIDIFNKTYSSFKKNGSREFEVLRSGPLVEASLNITCDKMYTQIHSAEHILQRIGRLDRFGENNFINEMNIYIPLSLTENKQKTGDAKFLNSLNEKNSAYAFYKFLKLKSIDGKQDHNKNIMKNKGRSLDTPLFLSYSDDHLSLVNLNENDDNSWYYISTNKQPVGIISFKKLKIKKEKYDEN